MEMLHILNRLIKFGNLGRITKRPIHPILTLQRRHAKHTPKSHLTDKRRSPPPHHLLHIGLRRQKYLAQTRPNVTLLLGQMIHIIRRGEYIRRSISFIRGIFFLRQQPESSGGCIGCRGRWHQGWYGGRRCQEWYGCS